MKRILISGGIGCGKTVVGRVVQCMGFPVYNCDNEAKRLMECRADVKARILREFPRCHTPEGILDRALLAAEVFASTERLNALNAIVHASVRADLERWFDLCGGNHSIAFVETAIPVTADIDSMVDEAWIVTAPLEVREKRVTRLRNMDRDDFLHRVEAQYAEVPRIATKEIINDDLHALLPQIERLAAEATAS